jgi:hypothetical protein
MSKNKKILIIGGSIEGALLIFALIVSIIVGTTATSAKAHPADWQQLNIQNNGAFIGFFQNNPTAFFLIICIPIFVMVALDFVYFAIVASKRESNLSDQQLAAIKKRAEEEVRAELMKEVEAEVGLEEKKADEPKEEKAE